MHSAHPLIPIFTTTTAAVLTLRVRRENTRFVQWRSDHETYRPKSP